MQRKSLSATETREKVGDAVPPLSGADRTAQKLNDDNRGAANQVRRMWSAAVAPVVDHADQDEGIGNEARRQYRFDGPRRAEAGTRERAPVP